MHMHRDGQSARGDQSVVIAHNRVTARWQCQTFPQFDPAFSAQAVVIPNICRCDCAAYPALTLAARQV